MKPFHLILLIMAGIGIATVISMYGNTTQYVAFPDAQRIAQENPGKTVHVVCKLNKAKPILYDAVSNANRLEFYGFEVPAELFMGWQFTRDALDESEKSYKEAPERFEQSWNMHLYVPELKEGVSNTSYRGMQIKNFGDFLQSLS